MRRKHSAHPYRRGGWLRPCWLGGDCSRAQCRMPRFGSLSWYIFVPRTVPETCESVLGSLGPDLHHFLIHFLSPNRVRSVRTGALDQNYKRLRLHFRCRSRPWMVPGCLRRPGWSPVGREARSIERAAADWLDYIENPRLRAGCTEWAGAGLGLGWTGGWGAGLTEPSNQRGRIFRVERPRPRSCWVTQAKHWVTQAEHQGSSNF